MSTSTIRDPRTAAYKAVMDWVDADPGRALVGCTPSMVAGVALTAYRKAGAEPTLVDNVRAELEEATSHMRTLADSNLGLVTWANAYHAERDELAERVEELTAELNDLREAETRCQELEAEIEELKAAAAARQT